MDWEKVFSLFGVEEEDTTEGLEDFRNTSFFKIRMFMKLIQNGMNFKKQVLLFFKKSNNELNEVEIDKAGDYMMYVRAFYWVEQLELDKMNELDMKYIDINDLMVCINYSILYFEGNEEYEKCAVLKKFQDHIQKIKKPLD